MFRVFNRGPLPALYLCCYSDSFTPVVFVIFQCEKKLENFGTFGRFHQSVSAALLLQKINPLMPPFSSLKPALPCDIHFAKKLIQVKQTATEIT